MRYDHLGMLPINAFKAVGKQMTLEGGGKGDSPPAPDYTAAANATAAGNLEAAKYTAEANRVNQVTPYGSLTYSKNGGGVNQQAYDQAMQNYQNQLNAYNQGQSGGSRNFGAMTNSSFSGLQNNLQNNLFGNNTFGNTGSSSTKPILPNIADYTTDSNSWTATQTLSPEQQSILNKTNSLNSGLMDTANMGLNYAQGVMSKPGVDLNGLPQVGINPGEAYQDAIMRRLQPQIDRENTMSDAQLANQGIAQGTEAYKNAKTLLGQNQNDRLTSAVTGGFNTGLAANQNAFQQQSYNQMQPINVINALRTGSQVQNPNFVGVPQQANTQGPDLLGATTNKYNAQLGASNASNAASSNFMGGLMGLGGAIFSDINLKENIKKVGSLDNGLNLYSYNYKDGFDLPTGRQVGVMAQEVEKVIPEAVTEVNGYKAVRYDMLGV
jgi:hypothetical protein